MKTGYRTISLAFVGFLLVLVFGLFLALTGGISTSPTAIVGSSLTMLISVVAIVAMNP